MTSNSHTIVGMADFQLQISDLTLITIDITVSLKECVSGQEE